MNSPLSNPLKRRTIKIKCYDGILEMEEHVVFMSPVIAFMINKSSRDSVISFRTITSRIMRKVIEYCNKNWKSVHGYESEEVKNWNWNFIKSLETDMETVYCLMEVAEYLKIETLFNLLCKVGADVMRGNREDEIYRLFNFGNHQTRLEFQVRELRP
ncbi:SKP1-like 5 [Euphorbia peplus]|nr:SKP1-like 5 [Euphorbia peplus]